MKVQTKFTLFYAIVSIIIFSAFTLLFYRFIFMPLISMSSGEYKQIFETLEEHFFQKKGERPPIGHPPDNPPKLHLKDRKDEQLIIENPLIKELVEDRWFVIVNENNRVIFHSAIARAIPFPGFVNRQKAEELLQKFQVDDRNKFAMRKKRNEAYIALLENKKVSMLFHSERITYNGKKYFFIIGTPKHFLDERIHGLNFVLVSYLIIFSAILSIVGFFFTRYVLSPVKKITDTVDKITHQNLSERIPVKNNDEFGKLGKAINLLFERLDKSFKMQKEFISDASHELKTPLSVLKLSLENNLDDETVSNDERQRIVASLDTVNLMDGLVKKLLFISRLEKDRDKLHIEKISLNNILKDCVETLSVIAEDKGLKLISTFPEEDIYINADRQLLFIALFNIIDNAIKYTSNGQVKILLKQNEQKALIKVSDTGIGMNNEDKKRIFERFYRADKSRKTGAGYGIGLSITKRIIDLHEGEILVESELEKGTEVCLKLDMLK